MRKRKTDPKEVQKLFELYALLNHGGKHWIKGYFYRRLKGEMCYCLEGGLNRITRNSPQLRWRLTQLLKGQLRGRHYSIIGFNDAPETTWDDVKKLIFDTIEAKRKIDEQTIRTSR